MVAISGRLLSAFRAQPRGDVGGRLLGGGHNGCGVEPGQVRRLAVEKLVTVDRFRDELPGQEVIAVEVHRARVRRDEARGWTVGRRGPDVDGYSLPGQ